jgi:hypothetical protein
LVKRRFRLGARFSFAELKIILRALAAVVRAAFMTPTQHA